MAAPPPPKLSAAPPALSATAASTPRKDSVSSPRKPSVSTPRKPSVAGGAPVSLNLSRKVSNASAPQPIDLRGSLNAPPPGLGLRGTFNNAGQLAGLEELGGAEVAADGSDFDEDDDDDAKKAWWTRKSTATGDADEAASSENDSDDSDAEGYARLAGPSAHTIAQKMRFDERNRAVVSAHAVEENSVQEQ